MKEEIIKIIEKKREEFNRKSQGNGNGRDFSEVESDGRILLTRDGSCTIPDYVHTILGELINEIKETN